MNTLQLFNALNSYWLHVTEETTLFVGVDENQTRRPKTLDPGSPAIYYGWITSSLNISAQVGSIVQARVGGTVCSEAQVQELGGNLAYVMQIAAHSSGESVSTDCGNRQNPLTFYVDGIQVADTIVWDNTDTKSLHLQMPNEVTHTILLPYLQR